MPIILQRHILEMQPSSCVQKYNIHKLKLCQEISEEHLSNSGLQAIAGVACLIASVPKTCACSAVYGQKHTGTP